MRTIGYFVPEFPGQTHIFFWREMAELRQRGLEPVVISTRKPPRKIMSHSWAEAAMQATHYLFPPSTKSLLDAFGFTLKAGPRAWLRCLNVVMRADVTGIRSRVRLLLMILMGARLCQLARDGGFDHVHVHSCADAANVALFAKLLGNLNYSMTLHGPLSDYGTNQHAKWENSEFSIVITRKLFREVHDELAGSLPFDVCIAPMGVNLKTFSRQQAYEPWSGSGPLRIFSCGRLNPCKGHEYLIRAVALLRDHDIDAQLEIAGAEDTRDPSYADQLRRLIEELNLQSHVTLLGAVSEPTIVEHLEQAHLFGLASLHEPLGVVIMEAMAMQLPVVATRAGGVAELVTHTKQGLLVSPESAPELADAILDLAWQPRSATQMGRAGRSRVETFFHSGISAETIASRLLDPPTKAVDSSPSTPEVCV